MIIRLSRGGNFRQADPIPGLYTRVLTLEIGDRVDRRAYVREADLGQCRQRFCTFMRPNLRG